MAFLHPFRSPRQGPRPTFRLDPALRLLSAKNLSATDTTPAVTFDPARNLLRFAGESYPEDVTAFYHPVAA